MPTAISYATEQEAIMERLEAKWSTTAVAWPNKAYEPTEGTPYIEPHVVRMEAFPTEIRPGAKWIHHPGLLTIAVRVPVNSGDLTAIGYADSLAALFRNFAVDQITFYSPTVRTPQREGAWYRVQVDCPFRRQSLLSPSSA
jgi:hypothetical protein